MGYLYLLYCLIATLYNIFMDVSKFYHGDYYLEELKTIEGKWLVAGENANLRDDMTLRKMLLSFRSKRWKGMLVQTKKKEPAEWSRLSDRKLHSRIDGRNGKR